MDPFPWDLLVLAAILLANRTLVPSLKAPAAFWAFQCLNLGAATWFAVFGILGMADVPVAQFVVAALLVFHAVQNLFVRKGGKKL